MVTPLHHACSSMKSKGYHPFHSILVLYMAEVEGLEPPQRIAPP